MLYYIIKRIFLMIPTLFGIMLVTFAVAQVVPGGPVEQTIARLTNPGGGSGLPGSDAGGDTQFQSDGGETLSSKYRGAQGLDPEFIAQLEKQFYLDKPAHIRFFNMMRDYLRLDFGTSYYRDISVLDLIKEKLPVSISLGLWLMIAGYLISIPLGVAKAVRDGSRFDFWTSMVIIIGYSIPSFLLGIFLKLMFAGASFFNIFPHRGLFSENFETLSLWGKIIDYFWHLTLPLAALGIGIFATKTLLTKNSFIDEISKQYVITARAKGLSQRGVLYGHVFRNAMLIVIAGFPAAVVAAFFSGSLLIEQVFNLDGLGLLSYTSIVQRDYPIVFATLFIFSLIGMLIHLMSDLIYMWIDPRIDFEAREV